MNNALLPESERLYFREYTMEDFGALYEILSDPETMAHYPKPYDKKGTKRWLEWSLRNYRELGFGWWALVRKDTGEFIGDCGITMQNINGQMLPEIGYHLHKNHWRQGFGKEAARAVRDWGFRNREFAALYSYMHAGNTASWSTAAAAGMRRIGEYVDEEDGLLYIYRITREEWE